MKYIITESQYETLVSEFQHDPSQGEFDPKKESKVFFDVKVAYHTTPDIYLNAIKQNGLIPKSENKMENHPERIYVYLDPSNDKSMTGQLWNKLSKDKKDRVKDYYILKIDLTKIPNHKFYLDKMTMMTVKPMYTYDPIPSSAIEVIKKIPVSELRPDPSPEEQKKEEEELERIIAQQKAESEKPDPWAEILKQMEKLDSEKMNMPLENFDKLKENISRTKTLIYNHK